MSQKLPRIPRRERARLYRIRDRMDCMSRAVAQFVEAHPELSVTLDHSALEQRGCALPVFAQPLADHIDTFGADPPTREMLRAMNAASNGQATLLEAQMVIVELFDEAAPP